MSLRSGGSVPVFGMLVLQLLFPVSTPGITIRDDEPDSDYLALAADPTYASVGSFVNSWGYTGSAVLIAPDWVLTAAHNLVAASSATFTVGGVSYTSTELFRNPNYQTSNPIAGSDFGLVHLSTSVTGILPATLYAGSAEYGQVGTAVGFGFTGTGLTGYNTLDGKERGFQNMIDGDFGNPTLVIGCDFDNPHSSADNGFGDPMPLTLEGCVAPGDSGGGLFITIGGQTYLAGITSFVANTDGNGNSDYGDFSGFGRVSAFTPWISSIVPEPSALALLSGAGLVMFLGRRRR